MAKVKIIFESKETNQKATLIIEETDDSYSIKSEFEPAITNNEPDDLFTTLVGAFFSVFKDVTRES